MLSTSFGIVELTELPNGDLMIAMQSTVDAWEERFQLYLDTYVKPDTATRLSPNDAWLLLMEDIHANSEFEVLSELDIAAIADLTSAPVICYECERDDDGKLMGYARKWSFVQYERDDEVYELLETGSVVFTEAKAHE